MAADTSQANAADSTQRGPLENPLIFGLDLDRIVSMVQRQALAIGIGVAIGIVAAFLYLMTAVPLYTASTDLLIDGKRPGAKAESAASLAELSFDTSAIDSQVEVLKSEKVILAVIKKLNLTKDPVFMAGSGNMLVGVFSSLRGSLTSLKWLFGAAEPSQEEVDFKAEREAVNILSKGLEVKRVARTFVLTISYRGTSPQQAAAIARAVAEAYLDDQLEARYETSRRASEWLLARIAELRQKSLETDTAVQQFKARNEIAMNGQGQLVNQQQLGETNSRLITARTEVSRARSRYERIQSIMNNRQMDAAVSESLVNPVIVDLRNKMLRAAKTEAEISARLGSNHMQAVNLRAEMAQYERLIFDEIGRIAESYRSELDIATNNERATEEELRKQMQDAGLTNKSLVQLRELEREAESYRSLYQTFLQRYQETVQSLSFPINDARVITIATPPLRPSHPKKLVILVLGLIAGLGLGGAIALWREFRDRGFRTSGQVRDELGLEFIGMLQDLTLRNEDGTPAAEPQAERRKRINRFVLDKPLSSFGETLRAAKIAVDIPLRGNRTKVVGIISVLPSEGKSAVSMNFASMLASSGARTLLIDGDLRNPDLSRSVAPKIDRGLVDLLLDGQGYESTLLRDDESGLLILPGRTTERVTHSADLLSSQRMQALIDKTRDRFDYVVVDLPPLGPIVDVRAAQSIIDAFVFVVKWGDTARSLVRNTLESDMAIYNKTVGVVLNQVDYEVLKFYENQAATGYYMERYGNYYRHAAE